MRKLLLFIGLIGFLLSWHANAENSLRNTLDKFVYENELPFDSRIYRLSTNPGSYPHMQSAENDSASDALYIRVNMPVNANIVNLFVLDIAQINKVISLPDSPVHPSVKCNCQALRYSGVRYILCAEKFLFGGGGAIAKALTDDIDLQTEFRTSFANWIIAHELGHHRYNHPIIDGNSATASEVRRYELEADLFAASSIAHSGLVPLLLEKSFGADFSPTSTVGNQSWIGNLLSKLNSTTHRSLSERVKQLAHVTTLAFELGKQHRGKTAATLSINWEDCGAAQQEARSKSNESDHDSRILQFMLATRQERGKFFPSLKKKLTDSRQSNSDALLSIAACQAALHSGDREFCKVVAEGHPEVDSIANLLISQTLKLSGSDIESNLIDSLIKKSESYVVNLYQKFGYNGKSPSFSFLVFRSIDSPFVDCGQQHLGYVQEERANCHEYAMKWQGHIGTLNATDRLTIVNLAAALNMNNALHRIIIADLMVVYSISLDLGLTLPIALEVVDEYADGAIKEQNLHEILLSSMLYEALGEKNKAQNLMYMAYGQLNGKGSKPEIDVQILTELGMICRDMYRFNCATKMLQRAMEVVEISAVNKTFKNSAQELIEFQFARALLFRAPTRAREILERQLSDPGISDRAKVGLMETLAELEIWGGDGKAAAAWLDRSTAFLAANKASPERLSYRIAIQILLGNLSEANKIMTDYEKWFLDFLGERPVITVYALNPMIAIDGSITSVSSLLGWRQN